MKSPWLSAAAALLVLLAAAAGAGVVAAYFAGMSYRLLHAGRLARAAASLWCRGKGRLGAPWRARGPAIQLGQLPEGELHVLLTLLARQRAVGRELQDTLEQAARFRAISATG